MHWRQSLGHLGGVAGWVFRPVLGLYINNTERTSGLVLHKDSVLLVKELTKCNTWSLPGGGSKAGESLPVALQRELQEELSLGGSVIIGKKIISKRIQYSRRASYVRHVFRVEASSKEFKIRGIELSDARWFPVSGLPRNRSPLIDKVLYLLQ